MGIRIFNNKRHDAAASVNDAQKILQFLLLNSGQEHSEVSKSFIKHLTEFLWFLFFLSQHF